MPCRSRWLEILGPVLGRSALLFVLGAIPAFGHGGYHERMAYLTAELEQKPEDAVLRFELGNLHGQHGDLQLSMDNFDRVDALAAGKFLTDLGRGEACLVAGDFPKAKQVLDRQLVSHPECARAWLLRARAEQHMIGQDAACLADYREALKRTPSPDPDLVQEVAGALAMHHCEKEAAEVLEAGIKRLGKIPSLILRAVDLEIATKNFDAALRRIDEAGRAAPRAEPWMARRAAVLAQAGRVEESRVAWKELTEHLESLPDQERKSYAMSRLLEEARQGLASLESEGVPDAANAKP